MTEKDAEVRDWRFCPSSELMGMSNHFDNYDSLLI